MALIPFERQQDLCLSWGFLLTPGSQQPCVLCHSLALRLWADNLTFLIPLAKEFPPEPGLAISEATVLEIHSCLPFFRVQIWGHGQQLLGLSVPWGWKRCGIYKIRGPLSLFTIILTAVISLGRTLCLVPRSTHSIALSIKGKQQYPRA